VPDLPPSDAVVETPPDETSSTSLSLSPSSKPERERLSRNQIDCAVLCAQQPDAQPFEWAM
jgi:hypothetical protein